MIKYNNYKDSGIEWLGQIPEHWLVRRVKDYAISVKTGSTPSSKNGDFFIDGTENWYTPSDINNGILDFSQRKVIKKAFIDKEIHIYPKNSIYLIGIGGTLGKVGISPISSGCNQQINVIVFNYSIIEKYAFYQLLVTGNTLIKWSNYTTMPIFTQTDTKRLKFVVPPLQEQTAIAQYLDEKTQAIDKKVTLLQQKISYYKELRKAIINKAVTKGLTHGVEMKDSNIDWIGQIPKHWEVKRVKDLFKISRGRVISKEELLDDGKFPVYSSQTENQGILGMIDTYDFDADLITWTTDGVNAGTVFRRQGKFSCTNICGTLIPQNSNKISLDYFGYSIAESAKHNKRIDTNGAKIMSNEMAFILIIIPPKAEQTAIANYLDEKTAQIDSIISNIEQQINTLKELRKTLINDVVTGKIKVA